MLQFLANLRMAMTESGFGSVVIDFRRTMIMYAGATLLFTSELELLLAAFPEIRIRCRASLFPIVNEVLVHLRVFEQLKYSTNVVPRRRDVVSWRKVTADDIDCTGAGKTIETYESLNDAQSKLLFKGASEAISNVIDHAYAIERSAGLPQPTRKAWYMFCREDYDQFFLAICDLGAGIPETLTRKHSEDLINAVLAKITRGVRGDAELIEAAMEIARTRTRNAHQGLGLQDLKTVVDRIPNASLHIYSNRGALIYRHGKLVTRRKLSQSIGGTLVLWRVPLNAD